MNRAAFFAAARAKPFGGSLSQSAVDGCDAILDAWETYGDGDANKLAYLLATAWHESDRFKTMTEYASGAAYEGRKDLGNTVAGDGKRFKGRGFVQLTGRRNYTDWAQRTGIDIVANPDLVKERPLAARILAQGCMLGTFTGKKLGDYIGGSKVDFPNARRVINGTDKAPLIAGYAESFAAAIRAATKAVPSPEPTPKPAPLPTAPDPAIGTVGQSIIASLTIEVQDLKRRVEILETARGS
ncbi:glycoside hydrolase family 19 protein [Methylopila sp. 73B]|uniref:glycoside hydrolase family 19 protein n=1 Tax=Methylopila sp. 73B TaxID=1120792 RepID=UPI00036B3E53|nr:glycoside hydrolase family 19 protein [Methylopila sp. 73B]